MRLHTLLLAAAIAAPAAAQRAAVDPVDYQAAEAARRATRLALTGDLGLPELEPLRPDNPLDTIYFADRQPPSSIQATSSGGGVLVDKFLSASETGTGVGEFFQYQEPMGYSPTGPGFPLIMAYHGFGASDGSVANATTIDEEAYDRGWFYLSPTGLDDQLFGSRISQQNTEAALQWMLDNFNIDEDRLYAVGFSMGGGVVGNFVARRRDGGGNMFAAVGTVSATLDWTMEYDQGAPGLQTLLENPFNFGGDPATFPFLYQAASVLFFQSGTYPPFPGTLDPSLSMGTNLELIPVYITYDTGDTIPQVPSINEAFATMLTGLGATVQKTVKTGTPTPHSWEVLDVEELFDFFDGVTIERYPQTFSAQQDVTGAVSWMTTTQDDTEAFVYVDGTVSGTNVVASGLANAAVAEIDAGLAGQTAPMVQPRVTVTNTDADPVEARFTGFVSPPSYLLDAGSGALVTLVDSDPLEGTLLTPLDGGASLDAVVVSNAAWTTALTATPDPALIGQMSTITIDSSRASTGAWFIVAVDEILLNVKGVKIAASPLPPAVILFLPLDSNGDTDLVVDLPNDPLLQGLRLPMQALCVDDNNFATSVSNLWGYHIE